MITFRPLKYVVGLVVLLVIYIAAAIGVYFYQNNKLTNTEEGIKQLELWQTNFVLQKCSSWNLLDSLHNSSLIGVGYIVFPVCAYVFTMYRTKISSCMTIEDYHTYN